MNIKDLCQMFDDFKKPQLEMVEKLYDFLDKNYTLKIVETHSFNLNNKVEQVLTRKLDGLNITDMVKELTEELKGVDVVYLYQFGIIKGVMRDWMTVRFHCDKDTKESKDESIGVIHHSGMFPSLEILDDYIKGGITDIVHNGLRYGLSKTDNVVNIHLKGKI